MEPTPPTPREAARRYSLAVIERALRDLIAGGFLDTEPEASGLAARLDVIEGQQAHMHADLVALREWCRIPRPECYPETPPDEERAERAQEE